MKHEAVLHRCAGVLLEKEKIGRDEFEALFAEVENTDQIGQN